MTNETTAKIVFEMLHLTPDQIHTAKQGLATFKAIANSANLGDWVDIVARFTQPLDLPEALAQVLTDLQALQSEIRIHPGERVAAVEALRESLKPYFDACDKHAAVLDERIAEARRNISNAQYARSRVEELKINRAHAAAIAEEESRADVEGAQAAFDTLLMGVSAERAAIARFRRRLDLTVLPQSVKAMVQPVEA